MGVRFIGSHAVLPVVMAVIIFVSSLLIAVPSQSVHGVYFGFFDEFGSPLSGVNLLVQVWAVDPKSVPSTVNIYYGWVSDSGLFISADDPVFRRVLDAWSWLHPGDYSFETFLGVFAWAIVDGKILTYPLIIVNYNPLRVLRSVVRRDIALNVRLYADEGVKPRWVSETKGISPANGYGRFWDRVPELSWESGNYIQVPILIVYNYGSVSGVIASGIAIGTAYTTGFRISIGYGVEISSKWYNGISPTISFQIGSATISGRYIFSRSGDVYPGEKYYYWISAKVAHIHWREYEYRPPPEEPPIVPTGNEIITDKIYDIQVSGSNIIGGAALGNPPYESEIFQGSKEEKLIMPSTALSDGMLAVGEVIQSNEIFNWYDAYNVDFEVGIPVGAIAATALGNLPAIALQTIRGICVSLSHIESAETFIVSVLENRGQRPGGGYNVPETIYMRVSKLNYTAPNGYVFKVPMGIYFTCV